MMKPRSYRTIIYSYKPLVDIMKKTNSSGWSRGVLMRAVISACCGSLASVCGKIAFDSSENSLLVKFGMSNYAVKGLIFLCVLLFNSIMLSLYVRVLQAVSALQASLLAFVCNYLVSTVMGIILFGEQLSPIWIVGAVLMTLGAIRISSPAPQKTKKT
jgi:drug/metabolite transporter (DMT)-like permease